MRFCTNCGNQLPDDAKFCANCGTAVQEVPSADNVESISNVSTKTETLDENGHVAPFNNPTVNANTNSLPTQRSKTWMIAGICAFILSIFAWGVDGTAITIVVAVIALALGIVSLIKKAKFRAFPILAIIFAVTLLGAWILQWTVFDKMEEKAPSYQKVTFQNIEFTIPDYYVKTDSSNDGLHVYAAKRHNDVVFLDFGYSNVYNDGGATANTMASYESLIKDNQAAVDEAINELLEEAMDSGLKGMNADNVEFVKNFSMAGYNAQEYKCTCESNGNSFNTHVAAAIDIMTGDVYYVILGEAEGLENKYLSEFDGIVTSAKNINNSDTSSKANPSTNKANTEESQSTGEVSADFKKTMDSYEQFFNDYVDFIKKYSSDSSSANAFDMLSDYTEFMTDYAKTMEDMENIDTESLSPADYAYYVEVTARITKKLAEIGE